MKDGNPDLIICDEITSALDPLVARGILDLLRQLLKHGCASFFITHDLDTVRRIARCVAAMLKGRIVVEGTYDAVFSAPLHPYADRLLSSVPQLDAGWLDTVLTRKSNQCGSGIAPAARFEHRLNK